MPFTWSDQQLAIFSHVEQSKGSLNVIARAGVGKTTTAVEAAKRAKGRIFLGAFNKAIVDELVTRVASNPKCTASTFHSIGFKLWREIRQKAQVDSRKVATLSRALYPYDKKVREVINQAVSFAKLDGIGLTGMPEYTDLDAWRELFEEHDIVDDIPVGISDERVYGDCSRVFKKSLDMCDNKLNCVIDFDDMLYAPLYFGMFKPQRYDVVIMDEAQDTNETRLRIALAILADKGILIAVGDPKQAIYQFAGAASNAMDKIKDRTHAIELPLSVTYRCPKKVVEMVNEHVPDYKAADSNGDGVITEMAHTDFWKFAQTLDPARDAILCRMTRPLVGIAKRLRRDGIPCLVEGNNGKAIIALLTKWGTDITWGQYQTRVGEYVEKEVKKLIANGQEEKAEYLQEKVSIIYDIVDESLPDTQLSEIVGRIERMFGLKAQQNGNGVLRLCTVHRAKGREWKRVVLIGRNRYMPSPWAKTDDDIEAEANVEYVAITRTMEELVLVTVPPKPNKDKEEQEWWEL